MAALLASAQLQNRTSAAAHTQFTYQEGMEGWVMSESYLTRIWIWATVLSHRVCLTTPPILSFPGMWFLFSFKC